jgi:MFS family permease
MCLPGRLRVWLRENAELRMQNVPDSSKRELYVTGAIAAGSVPASFDASATTAALPVIRTGLATTLAAAGWLLLAELLATTGLLMFFGRLGDRRGHKPVYVAGLGSRAGPELSRRIPLPGSACSILHGDVCAAVSFAPA